MGGHAFPRDYYVWNGFLWFSADDGSTGTELWRTDGSTAGTVRFADLNPGAAHSTPRHFEALGNEMLFAASDANGLALWKTDGTPAGTTPVHAAFPTGITRVGNVAYFGSSTERWVTDGTTAGTRAVVQLATPYFASSVTNVVAIRGKIAFTVADRLGAASGFYVSDGTAAGTVRAIDSGLARLTDITVLGGTWTLHGELGPASGGVALLMSIDTTVGFTPNACPMVIDPNFSVFTIVSISGGAWSISLPLPVLPFLDGVRVRMQGLVVSTLRGVDVTNGLAIQFGR